MKRIEFFTTSMKGRRDANEDTFDTITIGATSAYGAVYDGHGGGFVSKYLKNEFLPRLTKIASSADIQPLVDDIQNYLRENRYDKAAHCGSTLLACHVGRRFLRAINIGDCRGVLMRGNGCVIPLTEDHKPAPEVRKEFMRIRRQGGGMAKFDREDRIWRTADGFAVSRAMGDLASPCLSHRADIKTMALPDDARFVLLGCDGIWDVLSNEQACTAAAEALTQKTNPARAVARLAGKRESMDNLTVVVMAFVE